MKLLLDENLSVRLVGVLQAALVDAYQGVSVSRLSKALQATEN